VTQSIDKSADVFGQLEGLVGDFWTEPSKVRPTDILVKRENLERAKALLDQNKVPYSIMIENVGELIYEQRLASSLKTLKQNDGKMNWQDYQRYDVVRVHILIYLDYIE
jgi:hypothetical protein